MKWIEENENYRPEHDNINVLYQKLGDQNFQTQKRTPKLLSKSSLNHVHLADFDFCKCEAPKHNSRA